MQLLVGMYMYMLLLFRHVVLTTVIVCLYSYQSNEENTSISNVHSNKKGYQSTVWVLAKLNVFFSQTIRLFI